MSAFLSASVRRSGPGDRQRRPERQTRRLQHGSGHHRINPPVRAGRFAGLYVRDQRRSKTRRFDTASYLVAVALD